MTITFILSSDEYLTNGISVEKSEINAILKAELAKPGNPVFFIEAEWSGIAYTSKYSKERVERLEPHTKNSLK
jgi:hypothetical protein